MKERAGCFSLELFHWLSLLVIFFLLNLARAEKKLRLPLIHLFTCYTFACFSEAADSRANRDKIGVSGQVLSIYKVLLTVKCSRSF